MCLQKQNVSSGETMSLRERQCVLGRDDVSSGETAPPKKVGPEKMKIFTPCFDPLKRRGIPDLGGVATGDGV